MEASKPVLEKPSSVPGKPSSIKESFALSGRVEIIVKDKNGKVIDRIDDQNIILDNGKQKVIESLQSGVFPAIFRIAIGDAGASIGSPFTPLVPSETETGLYHEVYRKDIGSVTVGTKQILFSTDLSSTAVPTSAFQNENFQVINEALLVMGDGILGGGDISPPATPDIDESAFAKRCFKSIPFEAVNDITITIRWTIYIQ